MGMRGGWMFVGYFGDFLFDWFGNWDDIICGCVDWLDFRFNCKFEYVFCFFMWMEIGE